MKKLLMGAVVISSLLMAGCNSADKGDPKSVLISFFDALAKKDIAAARKLATAESKSMLDMMEMGMKMATEKKEDDGKYDKTKMEFGDAKVEGDKATIAVKEKNGGETTNFTLKKESGAWKVAFDKSSMMEMGMDKMKDGEMDMNKENMNTDSLGNKLKESMEQLEEATKKLKEQ